MYAHRVRRYAGYFIINQKFQRTEAIPVTWEIIYKKIVSKSGELYYRFEN